MQDIETIFKTLSAENKLLKPGHAYKTGQEGLLRAFYFFRWCNKSGFENLDKAVDQFIKKKVPEQQLEHFVTAMAMIDQYQTDQGIKDALLYMDGEITRKGGGVSLIETLGESKGERRILKNTLTAYRESLEGLKNRSVHARKSTLIVWLSIGALLLANILLAALGQYGVLLAQFAPALAKANPGAGYIIAAALFIIPTAIILFMNRHILGEQAKCGNLYPQEAAKMEKSLQEFEDRLKEKKIKLS